MSAEFSGKKTAFIDLTGGRVTDEHHFLLLEIQAANPYLTMREIVLQTSLEYARLTHSMGVLSLINARPRRAR